MPFLLALLPVLVPALVQFIESLIDSKPPAGISDNRAWVVSLVNEFVALIDSKNLVPGFVKPEEEALAKLLEDELNKALDLLEKAKAAAPAPAAPAAPATPATPAS